MVIEKKEAIPRGTASYNNKVWCLFRARSRRVGHRGFIRANRKRLERLAEVELAVLLIRIQLVEPLDGLVRTHIAHRELSRELMDNAAGALPMKKVGGGIENVQLADTDTHRVGIAVDVTVFGGVVEAVPETAIVAHIGGRKRYSPTSHKTKHNAGGKFLHFAMILPEHITVRLAKLRCDRKNVTSQLGVKSDGNAYVKSL
jgi:hypothetical protein